MFSDMGLLDCTKQGKSSEIMHWWIGRKEKGLLLLLGTQCW